MSVFERNWIGVVVTIVCYTKYTYSSGPCDIEYANTDIDAFRCLYI